jgi:glycosyltransferase involved in cell wall biosynthesis
MASALTGVPLVCHVHSSESRDPGLRWQNAVNSMVERFGFRRAAAVIAVSDSLGELLAERGVGDKLTVVHNGVPCRRESTRRVPSSGQADRSTPCEPLVLGTVALYRPRKGLEVFLQALAMLRDRGHAVRWRAVGRFETPEYERQIKRLVDQLGLAGIVQFVGFTRDVDAELDRIDLLVLPSVCREGLPMSVLEAMAAGVPVVGSRVEGIIDAVRDGRDGLLCEPNDPHDLAAAIERFATGEIDWPAMRANARKRQAESFSGRSMAAGVAEVYRRILTPGGLAAG